MIAQAVKLAYQGIQPVPDTCTVIVHCPCGTVWRYKRPRRYGGTAFRNKRCPDCGGNS